MESKHTPFILHPTPIEIRHPDFGCRLSRLFLLLVCLLLVSCSPNSPKSLIRKLKDDDPAVRRESATKLGNLKEKQAVHALMAALDDPDEAVQREAALALGKIGDRQAAPKILAMFERSKGYPQQDFAKALGQLKDPQAVPALLAAMEHQDRFGRDHLSSALAEIGEPALKPTIEALQNQNAETRKAAAATLVKIAIKTPMQGTSAKDQVASAVPSLITALRDPSASVRQEAANALGMIRDARAVEPLIGLLSDPNDDIRETTALALSGFSDAAMPGLVSALNHSDVNVRIGAARALGNIAEIHNSERAIQMLNQGIAQGSTEVAAGAYSYFISHGTGAPVLVAALEKHPTARMLNAFLNSGNSTLEEAAKKWAQQHGVAIESLPGPAGTARWGKR